ncbi:MAG TPA: ANTAR domain-containing protein [Actinophytocola sp.]|jgi:anti-anti-sigma regulatory factor|uniref:ANTAR domain-containing protein n=1 Tax=Actinophytocola sp. TaxID=1872138 RepID=UPI002F91EC55
MSVPDDARARTPEMTSRPSLAAERPDEENERAVVLVRLDGLVDLASSGHLGSRLLSRLDTPDVSGMDVVLDVHEATVVSAAGTRALTELAERLSASGRRLLVVAGAHRRTIELSQAGAALTTFTTVDAAMSSPRAGAQIRPAPDSGGTSSLAGVLSSVARSLEAEPDLEATLRAIIDTALTHIPGVEHAGISLVEGGRPRTKTPSADVVAEIDEVQYRLKEGPCVDAITDHCTYRTGDLAKESRWPAFGPAAVAHGVRSMLSYRLFTSETTMGALNLYSSQADAFSERTEQEGRLFATHAAIALVGAQKEAQLIAAIEHRDIIATAKGILMERNGVDSATAFRMLAEASQHTNMKLYTVAEWLVENRHEG